MESPRSAGRHPTRSTTAWTRRLARRIRNIMPASLAGKDYISTPSARRDLTEPSDRDGLGRKAPADGDSARQGTIELDPDRRDRTRFVLSGLGELYRYDRENRSCVVRQVR